MEPRAQETKAETIPQAGSALIVIDMQYDFLPGGSLAVKKGDQVISVIKKLMLRFSNTYTTQDWHKKNHISFASQHKSDPEFKNGQYTTSMKFPGEDQPRTYTTFAWPDHCVEGTIGARIHDDLPLYLVPKVKQKLKGDKVAIEAYSPFKNLYGKDETDLEAHLKDEHVETVFVCGLALDYCVKNACLDARKAGFNVVLVMDGTKAVNLKAGDGQAALEELKKAGVTFITSQQLLKKLEPSQFASLMPEIEKIEKLEDLLKGYVQHLGKVEDQAPRKPSKKGGQSDEDGDDEDEVVQVKSQKINLVNEMLHRVNVSKELLVNDRESKHSDKTEERHLAPLKGIVTLLADNEKLLSQYRGSKTDYWLSAIVDALSIILVVPAALRAAYSKYKYNNAYFWQVDGQKVAGRGQELLKAILPPQPLPPQPESLDDELISTATAIPKVGKG